MSIIQGSSISASSTESGGFYDYPIEQSLRFDGSSYLSRPFGSGGSTTTWTYSSWVKRSTLSSSLGEALLFAGTVPSNDVYIYLSGTTDTLQYFDRGTGSNVVSSSQFRDVSAWYHFVVSLNTSTAESIKFYINGSLVTDFSTSNYSTSPQTINTAVAHRIGNRYYTTNDMHFNGYMANIQFIDGQALDASYFGEISQDIWVPKTFDGTSSTGGSTVSTDYGTNGFLLDFSSISGTTINDTAPIDTNHSSANNWTATGF